MDSNTSPSVREAAPAWLLWARGLLLIAMSGAGYLAWVAIHNGPAAGCGPQSGCNAVLQSRWAYWLDIPVSIPAVLVYLTLLGVTVLLRKKTSPDDQRGSWAAIIVLSVIVAGSAFWFVSLQVFVIQAFCKYCLTAHACGFAAALLCLMNIPYATDPTTPMWTPGSGKRGVPGKAVISLVLVGLAGVMVLAGGQLLVQKQRNVVKVISQSPVTPNTNHLILATAPDPADKPPESPNARLIAPRTQSLYGDKILIKFDDVPMIGSPAAPHVLVCLLDYTCSHCRALHPILRQAAQQFSNQLAFVTLPLSLSPLCNPFFPQAVARGNLDSCKYARLGLAVWRANPGLHRQFDNWMFASVTVPPYPAAEAYAAQLVGPSQLATALADPWVEQQFQTDCKLYRANWLAVGSSAMPQLIMGDAVSSGPINSVQHLQILLGRYLNLNLAPAGF